MNNICKHGIIKEACSYCNGYHDNIERIRQEKKQKNGYIKKCKEYQKISISQAERYNYPIEKWELELFLKNTSEHVKDIDILFNIALELNRTFNAMQWWWHISYKAQVNGSHHAKAIINRIDKQKTSMALTF